jgi:uncharacterized ferritin-like protein (DUF455 family)
MEPNLFEIAQQCVMTADSVQKVQLTQIAVRAWRENQLNIQSLSPVHPILVPGQPAHLSLVPPKRVPRRTLHTREGLVALLHALAHIEFNAINLAWDAVYRFRDLPAAFYEDWIQVAQEESEHFVLLHQQLQRLDCEYGDLPAHNGLWEMAIDTADDVMVRMALVPRVLEARGLDATPEIIAKLRQKGETALIEILEIILREEIDHVAKGTRWFRFCCDSRQLEAQTTFLHLIRQHFKGQLKGTLNYPARLAAGFTEAELHALKSESAQKIATLVSPIAQI